VRTRRESLQLRRAVCQARIKRSAIGAWYRRIRRTRTTPVVLTDPTDDRSSPPP
jgi:hypothetical protein